MRVVTIVGPTGVGKTRLSVTLAKQFNGEIISGDSMQIYKTMDIGTAKVTVDEMQGVPHHLIDIKSPFEDYSVSEFQTTVRQKIEEITARGHLPIVVGGTGLYIKAVLYDYEFSEETVNHDEFNAKYSHLSNEEVFECLKKVDPQSAETLHPNNRRRILRALEIYEKTGVKKSESIEKQSHVMIYDAYIIGLTCERSILHQRINQRVDQMVSQGLEQEVKGLIDQGCTPDLQSMKAIGYKEWFSYFNGDADKGTVIEQIKAHSRQYARRQYTWFNHQMPVTWYDVDIAHFDETENAVIKDVKAWL